MRPDTRVEFYNTTINYITKTSKMSRGSFTYDYALHFDTTTGIGVDDMFLLMSCWSSTLGTRDLSVPQRIRETFRAAGIGITITSLTDSLAFAIGASSVFISVRNFCLYSGLTPSPLTDT